MIKILRHVLILLGILFIALGCTGAYYMDNVTINSNSFSTSDASPNNIILNEIYPNPLNDPPGSANESNGEWLEVYNNGDWARNINGWKIEDKDHHILVVDSSKTGSSTVVPAHGWLVVNRNGDPNFSLNNGDEIIYLYSDSMSLIDSFHYTSTVETKSWSRVPDGIGGWVGNQTPTPGATNG